MILAYADPPYPGCAHLYAERTEVDHVELLQELTRFDGWALSTHVPALRTLLPLCAPDVRVCAWVKPFAGARGKTANPFYAWEPVLLRPAPRPSPYWVRDWVMAHLPLRGFKGAKPRTFSRWLFEALRAVPGEDEFVDLFPGSGAVSRAWEEFARVRQEPLSLTAEEVGNANDAPRSREHLSRPARGAGL